MVTEAVQTLVAGLIGLACLTSFVGIYIIFRQVLLAPYSGDCILFGVVSGRK
jgi:hypothetical protein